jgi:hypothetical protein
MGKKLMIKIKNISPQGINVKIRGTISYLAVGSIVQIDDNELIDCYNLIYTYPPKLQVIADEKLLVEKIDKKDIENKTPYRSEFSEIGDYNESKKIKKKGIM